MNEPSAIENTRPEETDMPPGTPDHEPDEPRPEDEGHDLSAEFIREVRESIDEGDGTHVRSLCEELHPADVADLFEQISDDQRKALVGILGQMLDPITLVEVDEDVRDLIIEAMSTGQLADAVSELDTDDAAFVLEDMDEEARLEVLAEVPVAERLALLSALEYEDETAGRLMQREVFAAPAYWTVGQIIDRLRSPEELPETFYEVFVIDPAFKVIGSVPLAQFLRNPRETVIGDLVGEQELRRIPADMDQEEVAYLFEKYNLISAPVVDRGDRLVGMITVDDVVEIVHEETHEDMLALAGVEAEQSGISGSLRATVSSRFSWLAVNLFTAILASVVISFFDATLEQVVAVAILMPIVASMGGNAGTQTLTVAVRNLATRELTAANALRIVGRETLVGLINGCAFAVLMGCISGVWYGTIGGGGGAEAGLVLGLVLAAAMIINMIMAGLSGILIPLVLQRVGADPAVASAVFVTTVTDIVGFFAFLGLAAIFIVG
ncbi:magnesium transporter [Aquisalinus flavus]|uniref:Magnesium transporter MgtE n=1 Tax=Aquisalinus flavus TaxID=1526572 RepID=A0A8J2V4B5_9PROT|nr:magnesium transporter [Aquisalinus flavus]GGD05980.1 magnesium transporter MgtE [Aquisalinus flavus]